MKIKEFIEKTKEIHGGTYTYEHLIYKKSREKVIVTCKTHGDFEQTPSGHLSGRGCRKCSNNKKLTTKEFIEKSKLMHGERYTYRKVIFTNTKTKVIITCKEHGDFEQKPNAHLRGQGCYNCGIIKQIKTKRLLKN